MEKNDIEKVFCHPHRKQMSDRNKSCHNLLSFFLIFLFFFGKKLRAIDCKYDDNT